MKGFLEDSKNPQLLCEQFYDENGEPRPELFAPYFFTYSLAQKSKRVIPKQLLQNLVPQAFWYYFSKLYFPFESIQIAKDPDAYFKQKVESIVKFSEDKKRKREGGYLEKWRQEITEEEARKVLNPEIVSISPSKKINSPAL